MGEKGDNVVGRGEREDLKGRKERVNKKERKFGVEN